MKILAIENETPARDGNLRLRLVSDEGRGRTHYQPRRGRLSAQYRGRMQSVDLSDVIYLRADQKYVTVKHLGGELLVDESLRSLEEEFSDLFVRIHRNALVARSRLRGLEKHADGTTSAWLRDCSDRLSVSRRHLARIRRWLNHHDRQAG